MARLRFTSLVTTKSDPARWWPRVAILGVGLVVAVMVVLAIGPSRGTTLGFFVLCGLALVVHRFRVVSYRFLMRPRFVRFARIDRVQQGDRGVWLTLVDGRELLLPTTGIARARLAVTRTVRSPCGRAQNLTVWRDGPGSPHMSLPFA